MTAVCALGHPSETADFCDVCGAPIANPAAHPPAPATVALPIRPSVTPLQPPAPLKVSLQTCPHCLANNPADVLFCEDCGYDFATGQLPPEVTPRGDPGLARPGAAPPAAAAVTPPAVEWVAEIWVDPDWFTHQQTDGACPTSGLPTVIALRGTPLLIGRPSRSRNIEPALDCSSDPAISHRHADLTRNGDRWSVTDLGSTNGTFVASPRRNYPDDPLIPHQPRQLADDERVYLGGWTRIVVRKAVAAERAATAP